MLANFNNFGNREAFSDGIERECFLGQMLILLIGNADQVMDVDARMKDGLNRAAIPDLAKNHVALELHLDLLAPADTFGNRDAQSGTGDIENEAENGFSSAKQNLQFRGLLGGIAGFAATIHFAEIHLAGFWGGNFGYHYGTGERSGGGGISAGVIHLVWQRKPTSNSIEIKSRIRHCWRFVSGKETRDWVESYRNKLG